jgi:exopolysaccharide production protein ExoQ
MFESFTLFGFGWLLLVLCAVRAGQSRSWRERIDVRAGGPGALPAAERAGPGT